MTIRWNSFLRGRVLVVGALGLACSERLDPAGPGIVADATAPSATQATGYSGRATEVQATVLGLPLMLVDAGPLEPTGGAKDASLLNASVPGLLTAEVLDAETVGQGNASRSEASVAELTLTVAGNTISADFLQARATAMCTDNGATASGSSDITELTVNGQTVAISGMPNQTVTLPTGLGKVIINEQTPGPGGITVNALHVIVDGVADVVISSAHADITCQPAPPPPPPPGCTPADFITGGGWITSTPSGAKANFGVGGGIKQGAVWGHLTYIDHGSNGLRVKGTGVTSYQSPDPTKPTMRHISGTAEMNGQSGYTYEIDVADNGEPGSNDTFAIQLLDGARSIIYRAGGLLGGGNIQLHAPTCQ